MNQRFCIIIPALNEDESIGLVLSQLSGTVIVVDDGSTDDTARVSREYGAHVITLKTSGGSGQAVQKGLLYALRHGFEIAIQLDADGQHNPSDIPRLVNALIRHNADMVIGSRYVCKTNYRTPLLRKLSIMLLSQIIKFKTKRRIYDPTSGYRVFNKRTMKSIIADSGYRCSESVTLTTLLQNGYRVDEVPVEMHKRHAGVSKLTMWRGLCCLISSIFRIL